MGHCQRFWSVKPQARPVWIFAFQAICLGPTWSKEQIYYFLEGEGLLELGAEKTLVRPHQFAFIPAHLPHALSNTGLGHLVFLVITTATTRV